MSNPARVILDHLAVVSAERAKRAESRTLASKVIAVKAYQQLRFSRTYADLLASARYGPASRFFLAELYGPSDFARRDTQFARVVPALVRLFPPEIVETVSAVAELHALSERLDTGIATQMGPDPITGLAYVRAWQRHGGMLERQSQVGMTADIAARLDHLTRRVVLRASLKMMRVPAQAAGLGELQKFLENGFDTFKAMGGASEFIHTIELREKLLADALFAADAESDSSPSTQAALLLLP